MVRYYNTKSEIESITVLKDASAEQDKVRNWYMEAGVNYARSFGNHSVSALLLYNQSKTYYLKYNSDIPTGYHINLSKTVKSI